MGLPDSRNETAAEGVSLIKSVTWNQIQDEVVKAKRGAMGIDISICDHFTGDTLNRSIWVAPGTGANVSLVDDGANGARGALAISGTGSSIDSQLIDLDVMDWRIACRVRIPSYGSWSATKQFSEGLGGIGTGVNHLIAFNVTKGAHSDHWVAVIDAAVVDLGVGVDANYHFLEIRKERGILSFFFDTILKYSTVFSDQIISPMFLNNTGTGSAANVLVDSYALSATSYPSTGMVSSPGAHVEGARAALLVSSFPAANQLTVTFGSAFVDGTGAPTTDYAFGGAIARTDSGSFVGWIVVARTSTTMTFEFTDAFDGTFSWEASL